MHYTAYQLSIDEKNVQRIMYIVQYMTLYIWISSKQQYIIYHTVLIELY